MKRNAQSLSICVPGDRCINQCRFCVVGMHPSEYKRQMDENLPFFDLYFEDYIRRMVYAKENDANIMMITGDIEPLQNRRFLQLLGLMNQYVLPQKGVAGFNWIEIQTSGVTLDRPYARFLRNTVGVSVFSLSLASFDSDMNAEIQRMPKGLTVNIDELCSIVKEYDFTLRLSLNMSEYMLQSLKVDTTDWQKATQESEIRKIFDKAKALNADQITFRKFYSVGENEQSRWIEEHKIPEMYFDALEGYIRKNGKHIATLPYGYQQYSVNGISTVLDRDCMNEEKTEKETSKYFVLRPDCKLYDGWNKEDLIF